MSEDIRVKTSFRGHRKRKKLKTILGYDATGMLLDLWIGAALSRPDGILYGWDETDIAIESGMESVTDPDRDRYISALMSVGFLERNKDGIFILHDWVDHNLWASCSTSRSNKATFSNLRKYYPKLALYLEQNDIVEITNEEYKQITKDGECIDTFIHFKKKLSVTDP